MLLGRRKRDKADPWTRHVVRATSLAKKKKKYRERSWLSSDPEHRTSCLSCSQHLVLYQLGDLRVTGSALPTRGRSRSRGVPPCPGLPEPFWLPRCCSEPTTGQGGQEGLPFPTPGSILPQHSPCPLPSLPAAAGTPEQKKIMIIICCVILGIVIASTFGGIFG